MCNVESFHNIYIHALCEYIGICQGWYWKIFNSLWPRAWASRIDMGYKPLVWPPCHAEAQPWSWSNKINIIKTNISYFVPDTLLILLSVLITLISTKILGLRHYYCPHHTAEEASREVKKLAQGHTHHKVTESGSSLLTIMLNTFSFNTYPYSCSTSWLWIF